jgi:SAM-dependent methyltransferase
MLDAEREALQKFLPTLNGEIALQVGAGRLLEMSHIAHKFMLLEVDHPENALDMEKSFPNIQPLIGTADSLLPFASSSVDLCLLPHVLEFADDPHQLLRESRDILTSGGHLVILGFNPYSLWGARGLISRKRYPWNGHNLSIYRLKDWLGLLEFKVCAGRMLYYSPPVQSEGLRSRFRFMEKAGDRWWPMLGAAYIVVAQKSDVGMTVIDLREKVTRRSLFSVPEPAARTSINGETCQ